MLKYILSDVSKIYRYNYQLNQEIILQTTKSLVFAQKTRLSLSLRPQNHRCMVISKKIKGSIGTFAVGRVFTAADFDVERQYCGALIKSLNRMAERGLLQRLSKGKYYKPQKSVFGILSISETEIVKDFFEKDGKTIDYIYYGHGGLRLNEIDHTNIILHLDKHEQISSNVLPARNIWNIR